MDRKILFFDVDSTLYSHKTKSIPISAIKAIEFAKAKGHIIVLATGRSKLLTETLGIFEHIKFDYFVTINGTLILDKYDNVIFSLPCNKDAINKVLEIVDKNKLNLCFINKDDYYLYKNEDKRSHLGYDPLHIPVPPKKQYQKEDIYEMNLFCEDEYIEEFINATKNYLSYSKLNDYGYDVYAKDQTKATGIKHLIEYLNIDKKDTIAFGDGHNDREMIEFCEIGVAMGNALDKVKEVSNYITDDIDNDGIFKAMDHLNLI
jgi:Cof subfamily protein (haloacid dehalogenase superfamily)